MSDDELSAAYPMDESPEDHSVSWKPVEETTPQATLYHSAARTASEDDLPAMTAEEYRECARIHYREAAKLLERAHAAQAEDRQHEAMLLTDLAISQRDRADQYERAAVGQDSDPILDEIVEGLEEQRSNFTLAPGQSTELEPELTAEGRFARALKSILFHPSQGKDEPEQPGQKR